MNAFLQDLGHEEAFRVIEKGARFVVEHQQPAAGLYGAQAVSRGGCEIGKVEKPDFLIRGTTMCLMGGGYKSKLTPVAE